MSAYLITANVNVGYGLRRRAYAPGDPVATVGYYAVEADGFAAAAEAMFHIGNRMAADTEGQTWPADVRSLSVGDVLYLAEGDEHATTGVKILAVARAGWTEVPQPADHCQVELAGTDATSRPALGELPEPDYSCHCGSGQCRRHGG
jgi:hypothetical protein